MTLTRSALIVALAALVLVAARPIAGPAEQYPRGLMSVQPTASSFACTIEVRPVSFGIYDPLDATALDALGQVIYTCGNLGDNRASDNKSIRIEMTTGQANQFSPRAMRSGPVDDLDYNLYLDATHRTIWGQGLYGTDVYVDTHPPNRTPVIVPVYGRVFGLQDVPAGQYGDVVTARILF